MSSKVRVYEVARDLEMNSKDLVSLFQSLGVSDVRNHMSQVPVEAVDRVKRHLDKKSEAAPVVEERIRPTVVKRRSKRRSVASGGPASSPSSSAAPLSSATPAVEPPARRVSTAQPTGVIRREPAAAKPAPAAPTPGSAEAVPVAPPSAPAASRPAVPAPAPPPTRDPVIPAVPQAKPAAAVPAAPPTGGAGPGPQVAVTPAPPAAPTQAASAPATTPAAPGPPAAPKPAAAQPAAPKPAAAQPAAPKPAAPKPAAAQPVAPKPAAPKPATVPVTTPAAAPVAKAPAPKAPAAAPTVAATPKGAPAPKAAAAPQKSSAPKPIATKAHGQTPRRAAEPPPATAAPAPKRKTGIDVWEGRPGVPMPKHKPTPRRVQYDAKAGAGGRGGPARRGPMMGRGPGGRGPQRRGWGPPGGARRGGGAILTQERSAHKKVVKIEDNVTLQMLAAKMALKAPQLLRALLQMGMTGVNINSALDAETAKLLANEFEWEVENVAVSEEAALDAARGVVEQESEEGDPPRVPIVTVMGHVDHGKTSLLDKIRKASVASGEAGGITQHIGAYSVDTPNGKLTFLDTPGHAAFTAMRARGANCTDVVILVVAADDGVMPQTKEAIAHSKASNSPIVVAINKIDKEDAQPDRVRRELSESGLVPEEWGGEVLFTEVSAHTGEGIEHLLEKVLLQSEMLELTANPDKPASGVVIEARLDRGMGPVATVLVTDGTLRRGDVVLAGSAYGKVRAMTDHAGKQVKSAGPSTPVSVLGLTDVPQAGDSVYIVTDAKKGQEIADTRKKRERSTAMASSGPRVRSLEDMINVMSESEQLELNLIIKADVQGSVEALKGALTALGTEKVKVNVVHAAAGAITETDINLAIASGAIVIGFNVRPAGKAARLAETEKIQIRSYSIIYNAVDDVKAAMEGLLAPKLVEKQIGTVEILQTFRIAKLGTIAGCKVTKGVVKRNTGARLVRDGSVVWQGKLGSLKRFKDDAKEVREGFECGLSLEGYNDLKDGDVIEVTEVEEVKQQL